MAYATKTLSAYTFNVALGEVPVAVRQRAKQLIADFIGSSIRASQQADSTPSILAMLRTVGLDGIGTARVFGLDRGFAPATAALLNGAFGHSLDFDDTHAASSLHPSAPVVPAAIAAGEIVDASGAAVLEAIIAGYEVCCRLGLALDPTAHYARGFHPTATAGVFGAAAAASKLFGLKPSEIESAFGVAASQAAGSLQFLENGAWNKRYQVGAAAMNGLIAATLAKEGFVGATDAIDGKHGFLFGYTDGADVAKAVKGLGETYETLRIGVKPYPSCRYTHAALDGILALQSQMRLEPSDIQKVEIGLHQNGITLTGAPLEAKQHPKSVVDGQFSMPFTAAVALYRGSFSWDDYALLGNPDVEKIAERIVVNRDPRLENLSHPFGSYVSIQTSSGVVSQHNPDPSGEPENFPTDEQVHAKFIALANPILGDAAEPLLEKLLNLDGQSSVHELFR